jgi:hypothetical protein
MNDQLSQAYDIDNRRAGSYTVKPGQDISATDNDTAKFFLNKFVDARREKAEPNMEQELRTEDRFIVAGPGEAKYSLRNGFRANI